MKIKSLRLLYSLISGLIILSSCGGNKTSVSERPNFLVIISDDQTFKSISALNNTEIISPTMDRLIEQGITFTHSFNQGSWAGAVCVASRAMLNTGQTVFRTTRNTKYLDSWAQLYGPAHYQLKKEQDIIYEETEVKTWAEVFTEAGYQTFLTGKWHNSEYALLKGFEKAEAVGEGMYETFDEDGSSDFAYFRPNDSSWVPWDSSFEGHWTPEVKDLIYNEKGEKVMGESYEAKQHTSELYADRAINFLQSEARNSVEPFFMYVAFNAPHDPRQSPEEYVKMYDKKSIHIPENFLPEHPFDQGDHLIRDEVLCSFPRTEEAIQLHRNEYYAIISHFDYEMGRILEALEQTGEAENTYVIFTSDHGLAVGQHGLMGKQNQYDHSIRMPLIIAGPGLKKGRLVNEKVYMQSIFATTCDLAGIDTPETVEFKSLVGLLKDDEAEGEEFIFGSYRHLQRMIRSDEYKLIVYPEIQRIQLFNLENDPDEIVDLSPETCNREVLDNMFDILIKKQKELGDFLILEKSDYLN